MFKIVCFLHVKIQDGRHPAYGKAQNNQSIMNQLKMFCTLLFEVTKTIEVGCKTCISTKTSSDIQLHLFSVFCLRPHTETRHYKLCMRTPPPLTDLVFSCRLTHMHQTIRERLSGQRFINWPKKLVYFTHVYIIESVTESVTRAIASSTSQE